jgi:hypothetical protein
VGICDPVSNDTPEVTSIPSTSFFASNTIVRYGYIGLQRKMAGFRTGAGNT